jgi:hypothetical protein
MQKHAAKNGRDARLAQDLQRPFASCWRDFGCAQAEARARRAPAQNINAATSGSSTGDGAAIEPCAAASTLAMNPTEPHNPHGP